jgi:hypothetical protein
MKTIWKLDNFNYYVFGEDKTIKDNEPIPNGYTDIKPELTPGVGMYKPKLVNGEVVEGATAEEMLPPVSPKPEIDILKEQNVDLNLQIIDLWETLINGGVI